MFSDMNFFKLRDEKFFKILCGLVIFYRKWWGSELNDDKVSRNLRTQGWQSEGRQAESWTSALEQLVTV